jgi:dimethylhistidine N-methyltransferase
MNALIQHATQREHDDFGSSVIEGLSKPRKSLPCRFFYDALGSRLFEEITALPEYYPTRSEVAILEAYAGEMVRDSSNVSALVEFGSGSCRKTELLLERLPQLSAYVPIDVSRSALEEAKRRLEQRFPKLHVRPLIADFTQGVVLPENFASDAKLGFFPGSTIGNFTPTEAVRLLRLMRRSLSPDGSLIIGVDLKKDVGQLLGAYNDSRGLTAAFNLNLLKRINRELYGTFDLGQFRHEATYNSIEGRIEMHLVSEKEQMVSVDNELFHFRAGETIHTENSYKYSIDQFRYLARTAGWSPERMWKDASGYFSVHELMPSA